MTLVPSMNFLKQLVIFLLICGATSALHAQTGTIRGACVDQKGKAIENVQVGIKGTYNRFVVTDSRGEFRLEVIADTVLQLIFRYADLEERRIVSVEQGRAKTLADVVFNIMELDGAQVVAKEVPISFSQLEHLDFQLLNTPVERALAYTTAASSNNELTSNYNVRGGSYDENLVYVNGFLINRPFLTRAGQQEGLSFIHSALVKDVRFSGGGFDARFGDKLSSVLDIDYMTPDSLHASAMVSLLGVEAHIAQRVGPRFDYLVGARYRANGYLLNSLPTKGAYNPVFWDAQAMTNFYITEKLVWTNMIHFSSNNFRFQPQTQETDFGTVNEAYTFSVYFQGQEQTRFLTMTGASALKWKPTRRIDLDVYASVFNTNEQEYFDVLGQYYINLLEKDPSKEAYGDSIATVGVGSFLNHARNQLKATILNVYHNGTFRINDRHKLMWGIGYQRDLFSDRLSEWRLIDSAGYSLPQTGNQTGEIQLYEVIKGQLALENQRLNAFAQHSWEFKKEQKNLPIRVKDIVRDSLGRSSALWRTDTVRSSFNRFQVNVGLRSGYTVVNEEFYLTPRASVVYFPRTYMLQNGKIRRRLTQLRVSTGMYYQPPFYREFRTFDGQLNTNVRSQKSFHFVVGGDYPFQMWERDVPFKLTAEVYYKYLWDVNPYEVDNVRTRYYAENNAVAYAYGADINVHGQFVPGIESYFKIGFLSTKEDILTDSYKEYYNAAGEKIVFGFSDDQVAVDSATIRPGYIPRPTDQWMNFAILFQDRMPSLEKLSAQLGFMFNTRLPYGPPDFERFKDTLRQKSYFRVDLGISYDFMYGKKRKQTRMGRVFEDAIVSFEVFNLMGVNNVLSMQWIQDVGGKYYAIPNYLTQRRFNLKLILRI